MASKTIISFIALGLLVSACARNSAIAQAGMSDIAVADFMGEAACRSSHSANNEGYRNCLEALKERERVAFQNLP